MAIRQEGELRAGDRVRFVDGPNTGLEGVVTEVLSESNAAIDVSIGPAISSVTAMRDDLRRLISPQELVDELHREQPEIDAARAQLESAARVAGERIEAAREAADSQVVRDVIGHLATMLQQVAASPTLAVLPLLIPELDALYELLIADRSSP